jgi:hypothetical protein
MKSKKSLHETIWCMALKMRIFLPFIAHDFGIHPAAQSDSGKQQLVTGFDCVCKAL